MDIRTIAKSSISLIVANDKLETADATVALASLSFLVQCLKLKNMLPDRVKPLMNVPIKELTVEVVDEIKAQAKPLFDSLTTEEFIVANITTSMMQQYNNKLQMVKAFVGLKGETNYDLTDMNGNFFDAYAAFISQSDDELLEKYKEQLPDSRK